MTDSGETRHLVLVIGAGPAGIYGVRKLTEAGHQVVIINRDIKPGGLAEYGIFPTKEKMKEGLRKQFKKILSNPKVCYLGGVAVGEGKGLTLPQLQGVGFSAIVVAAGAQGTKRLGIAGEESRGVYHAKDVVYHYNKLPPFSRGNYEIGQRVAIIGMGNVMVDVANWLIHFKGVREVIVVARRGPKERAYDDREFDVIAPYVDGADLRQEIERIRPHLEAVGQDVDALIRECVPASPQPATDQRLRFRYLSSPHRVLGNERGHVGGLEVEENKLVLEGGRTVAHGLAAYARLEVDNVIYAIGDQVDLDLGLPYGRGVFGTNPAELPGNPNPAWYQAYDPQAKKVLDGIFLVGWSRKASDGLVGVAKQDAERGMKVVNTYLAGKVGWSAAEVEEKLGCVFAMLKQRGKPFATREAIERLEAVEREEAKKRDTWEYKFETDEEMLAAIALAGQAAGG